MFYRRRASPKHRYNIIEDYGGGGHRTQLRDLKDQLLCLEVPPLPPYIKEQEGGGGRPGGGAPGRSPTPTGSRTPSFPCPTRRGGRKGDRRGRKRGRPPPLLVQFGLEGEGRAACPGRPSSAPLWAHEAH